MSVKWNSLTHEYVNRNEKMKGLNMHHDVNISKADFGANLFVLICLVAWIVFLILT